LETNAMTTPMIDFQELIEKGTDGDWLREMIAAMIGGADHPFAQRRRIVAPRDPHGVCPARP
jgi:hypothetical protein